MGLYEVPLSMSLLGFGMGDYVSQLPYVWYYVGVKISVMCFWCLMFNLSGRCGLLFLLCFIAYWT